MLNYSCSLDILSNYLQTNIVPSYVIYSSNMYNYRVATDCITACKIQSNQCAGHSSQTIKNHF